MSPNPSDIPPRLLLPHTHPMRAVGIQLMPAGRDWDAVRVPRSIGIVAHEAMGGASRAVICDSGSQLYWLVPPGTAAGWSVRGTAALGTSTYVVIPPTVLTTGPGDHWERSPGPAGYLTDPHVLREALQAAVDAALGPRVPDLGAERLV
jgi:hypothetical protein